MTKLAPKQFAIGCYLALVTPLLVSAVVLSLSASPAASQTTARSAPDALTSDDEFSRKLGDLKSTATDLNKKIEERLKSLGRATDVSKARKEIEELRAEVSTLLAGVADNSDLSKVGSETLSRFRDKLKALETETRFKPEERTYLIERWRELVAAAQRATDELGRARKQLVDLLRLLQINEDFINELVQIRDAKKALEIIQQLTTDIHGAHDNLKALIGGIKPPGV